MQHPVFDNLNEEKPSIHFLLLNPIKGDGGEVGLEPTPLSSEKCIKNSASFLLMSVLTGTAYQWRTSST